MTFETYQAQFENTFDKKHTRRRNALALDKLVKFFGCRDLRDIFQADVQAYKDHRADEGAAAGTILYETWLARRYYEWLILHGKLEDYNPFAKIKKLVLT